MTLASDYPISLICQALDLARSSYYYDARDKEDPALTQALLQVAETWPTYGYRRVTAQLHREGWEVNSKRIRRLMRALGLQCTIQRTKRQTTDSDHPFPRYPNRVKDVEIIAPDQVWVADITYVRLLTEFVYLAVIMDVFTRCIRGWHLGRNLDGDLTLTALRRALQAGHPEIHHSDQGVQYAAMAYTELLHATEIAISMAEVGAAWQNGFVERLMRTIKEEEVNLSEYRDYHDAYDHFGRFLDEVYMHKRIHSSLGYLTPAEFETQWLAQHAAAQPVVT
jgi:transposase InsO family protein